MSTNQTVQIPDAAQLAADITALVTPAKIVAVAIAGPPGSGKSTLAADLARRIGPSCCLIPMDGFPLDNATLSARGLLSVKGAPETFAQADASEYALEVEDMVTLHFLDEAKRTTVQSMIDLGLAFETYSPTGTSSLMRLRPTPALLNLCPVHATKNTFGCITRRDISERVHDVVTQSVFKFSPRNASVREDTFDAAGRWLQTLLGASDYAYALGSNHTRVMTDRFQLEERYRLGYMLKPTVCLVLQTNTHSHTHTRSHTSKH